MHKLRCQRREQDRASALDGASRGGVMPSTAILIDRLSRVVDGHDFVTTAIERPESLETSSRKSSHSNACGVDQEKAAACRTTPRKCPLERRGPTPPHQP